MAKVRLEDVYDEDDDLINETRVHTHKHKNPLKDDDDVFAKNRKKKNTCKIKQRRRAKNSDEY